MCPSGTLWDADPSQWARFPQTPDLTSEPLEGMLEPPVSTAGSKGPDDAPVPSALDLELHASGHVEYGEASCVRAPEVRVAAAHSCLFRDEAERLAFMD